LWTKPAMSAWGWLRLWAGMWTWSPVHSIPEDSLSELTGRKSRDSTKTFAQT
jgi:hypothetical protein